MVDAFEKSIDDYVAERDKALTNLDIDWMNENLSTNTTDEVLLCAAHKARYKCLGIADNLRHESRRWLQERGYSRLMGDFLPADQLPE